MLPRGITGFQDTGNLYNQDYSEKEFKSLCYSIAHQYNYSVVSFDLDLLYKNFYLVEFKENNNRLYLLKNAYYPLIAFAKTVEFSNIKFMEVPFLFNDYEVHALSLSELKQDWHNLVTQLDNSELEQIKYWKPNNVAEIIFNFWD